MERADVFNRLSIKELNSGVSTGTQWIESKGTSIESVSPIDGKVIGKVQNGSLEDYEIVMKTAQEAFMVWRKTPAPIRGEVVRQIGEALRKEKKYLGFMITLETGKTYQE